MGCDQIDHFRQFAWRQIVPHALNKFEPGAFDIGRDILTADRRDERIIGTMNDHRRRGDPVRRRPQISGIDDRRHLALRPGRVEAAFLRQFHHLKRSYKNHLVCQLLLYLTWMLM